VIPADDKECIRLPASDLCEQSIVSHSVVVDDRAPDSQLRAVAANIGVEDIVELVGAVRDAKCSRGRNCTNDFTLADAKNNVQTAQRELGRPNEDKPHAND
jgi:hypothetical protein